MRSVYLGIDLGASKMLTVLTDAFGNAVGSSYRQQTGVNTTQHELLHLIDSAIRHHLESNDRLLGMGLGFPGLVDHRTGYVLSSVMINGWDTVALKKILEDRYRVACVVDNDVNCAAIAELGARPDVESMIFAAVGTGIGGAVVVNGELYHGASNCAGEFGHITIDQTGDKCWNDRTGTLNALASGTALHQKTGFQGTSLTEQWNRNNPSVVAAVEGAARALGLGFANIIYVLNPQYAVIGGGVSGLGTTFLQLVEHTAKQALFSELATACKFEFARTGYEAGALGAAKMIQLIQRKNQ